MPIIPANQEFYKAGKDNSVDLKAICIFAAAGFFLGEDTYFNNLKAMQPATEYELDENREVINSKVRWQWHYGPRDINLDRATEEFSDLFEKISGRLLNGKKIILPLSGGLDSRTQAAVLNKEDNVHSYSYKFADSFDETKYGREIANAKGFAFTEFTIPRGYLWKKLQQISKINQCYADFTHPRQMAYIEEISDLGDIFFLGHWGDVLFDDMKVDSKLSFDEQLHALEKKIIKRGGKELAEALWTVWGITGSFSDYFLSRISELLSEIKIDNANSRIRAFKSMYWAPRWTSANMNSFSHFKPVALPYYDDEMCKFICTIPEELLAGRKIQIEFIKKRSPELAVISWQDYDPLNLYNYHEFGNAKMLPLRVLRKGKRMINENVFGRKRVTRNWEIQFVGDENSRQLKAKLFGEKKFAEFIPQKTVNEFYRKFTEEDAVKYSHPVSMLLTLSEFSRINLN
jgi:asparagine synthetase B (glutamine-hydrolysing)